MNRMRQEIEQSALGAVQFSPEGAQQCFRFAEDFIGFKGHFPAYPILPAVLQVLLAQLVAEQQAGEKLRFLSLKRAKFSEQLRPDHCIDVRVQCSDQDSNLLCRCELHCEEKRAAGFTLLLAKG